MKTKRVLPELFHISLIFASIVILLSCLSAFAEDEIRFLSAVKDETGKWQYKSDRIVPYTVSKAGYGWAMKVSNQSIKKATISISAPERLVEWPKGATVSSDGQTATFVRSLKPKKNYIYDLYVIADGDPVGRYSMTVNIKNISKTFEFLLFRNSATIEELSVKEFIDFYYQFSVDESFLNTLNPFKNGTLHHEIQRQFLKDFLRNEKFAKRIYKNIKEQGTSVADYRAFGVASIEEITTRGMRKMSDSDKEEMLKTFGLMLREANVKECATFIRGEVPTKMVYSFLAKMDANDVKRYYRIITNAVNAELNYESEPTVSSEQQKVVGDALVKILMDNLTREQARLYLKITDSISSATDEELCWYGLSNLSGYLNLKGDVKKWALRSYFNSIK